MNRFWAVFVARNLEFFRDRGTLIWNIFLPVFLIFGFAFAFSGNNTSTYKIGTIGEKAPAIQFLQYKYLKFVPYDSIEPALKKLTHHQIDMVIDYSAGEYYINDAAPNGYLVEKILLSDPSQRLKKKTVSGASIRYIDWFVPGVIGMNILFGCLFGVGFVIVRYRKNGVLKRFKATPLRAFEFTVAQVFSRFFIVAFMAVVVYVGTNLFLHFRMEGSYLLLGLLTTLAILCHISLGLLFAARIKSEEVAGGLMNFVTFPMMILSGIFFSLEGTPPFMQNLSKIFPITHFIDASRKVMLDGVGFTGVLDSIIVMTAMTIVFLLIASLIFRWE
jgi:ABC-2 type transport system permease protein